MTFPVELKSFEGRSIGHPQRAPDEVNQAMIRHWVEAIGDELPIYTDAAAANSSIHGQIVAPPVMLQAWTMRGIKGRPADGSSAQDDLLSLLDSAGFTSVVATNCEQEYVRYLHIGDRLSVSGTIESVSDEKSTALGRGHFVTTRQTYTDAGGDVVATMVFRILKFRPAERAVVKHSAEPPVAAEVAGQRSPHSGLAPAVAAVATEGPVRPRPAVTRDTRFWFDAAREGRLVIQRCASCGVLRHPPEPMCAECQSLDWDVIESAGRGPVYSFVVNHYPQAPAFEYPLIVALIELEEGTRLISNLIGLDPADVYVGMPVEVEFVTFDVGLTLPQFRPAGNR